MKISPAEFKLGKERFERAKKLCDELMRAHAPGFAPEWQVKLDPTSLRRLGCCQYSKKTILFSLAHIIHGLDESIEDTGRHEVAHMLTGCLDHYHGHGDPWVRRCAMTGARPIACATLDEVKPMQEAVARYKMTCSRCHEDVGYKYQRPAPNRVYKHKCGGVIVVTDRKA